MQRASDHYDVLIVGGGIHGVGVAQAAAAAGYRTLLVERERLAYGTSSRSSKLIHGGLRYLASGQFSLVRTSLKERELLLRIAPGLVRRANFLVPLYSHSKYRPWQMRVGLTAYALLAGGARSARFRTVPRAEWAHLDGLVTAGLRAVFCYGDAQTDDVALTEAVMRSAEALGAELVCPGVFVHAERRDDRSIVEIECRGERRTIETRVIMNAAGPWLNDVLARVNPPLPPYAMDLVQGTHVVLPGTLERGVYYAEAVRDQRPVFMMPWHGATLVGTTETAYQGDPAHVAPLDAEIEYLLATWRHYFPERSASTTASFAGLRVLPRADGSLNRRPRETVFLTDRAAAPRIVSIAGGKLTAYRATALAALARARASLPPERAIADTATLPIA
ncbi:MAG: glycerol-3-phosphate dehydrogenase/oxidase [Planctomycetota bacterium]